MITETPNAPAAPQTLVDLRAALSERHSDETADARREYSDILDRADEPQPLDAELLASLAERLNIPDAQVASDVRMAVERREKQKLVADLQAKADALQAKLDELEQRRQADAGADAAAGDKQGLGFAAIVGRLLFHKERCKLNPSAIEKYQHPAWKQFLRSRGWKARTETIFADPVSGRERAFQDALFIQADRDMSPLDPWMFQCLAEGASKALGIKQPPLSIPR